MVKALFLVVCTPLSPMQLLLTNGSSVLASLLAVSIRDSTVSESCPLNSFGNPLGFAGSCESRAFHLSFREAESDCVVVVASITLVRMNVLPRLCDDILRCAPLSDGFAAPIHPREFETEEDIEALIPAAFHFCSRTF